MLSTIVIRNLTKIYDNNIHALKGVSLEIKKGEIFSILGPNGAGKTTLIKIIVGQLKPTSGEVLVLDKPISEFIGSPERLRLSYVPQENLFWDHLKVLENLKLMASLYDIPKKEAMQRIQELLDEFKLSEHKNVLAEKLSGGMKRKLAIAMALLNDPDIIILDEPTTGLDPRARAELLADIEVLRGKGKTVIITTHIIEEAERLSDRVAIMDEGRILDVGSPEEVKMRACGMRVLDILTNGSTSLDISGILGVEIDHSMLVRVGDRFVIKLNGIDVHGLLDRIESNPGIISATIRKSTLEDAFLFLTGKTLE